MARHRVRSKDRVHRLFARHDLLRPLPVNRILDAVDHAVLAAATATFTAYTGLHARLRGFRPEILDRHLYETKELVKVHAFRGGFFLLQRPLLATVLAASRPGREAVCRAYRRKHRVSMASWRRLHSLAVRTLGDRAMDARELAKAMGSPKLPPTFLRMLSVEGTFVQWTPTLAPSWDSSVHRLAVRSVLFPDSDPDGVDVARARTALLRRYLEAYGPASVKDIAWWLDTATGSVDHLLLGIRNDVGWTTDEDTGRELVGLAKSLPGRARVLPPILVPGMDHVPRAYREREFFLRPEWYDQVVTRDGNVRPSVWVDGEIRGRWTTLRRGGRRHAVVWMFVPFSRETRAALTPRARRMASFAGVRSGGVFFADYPSGLPAWGPSPPLPRELAGVARERGD